MKSDYSQLQGATFEILIPSIIAGRIHKYVAAAEKNNTSMQIYSAQGNHHATHKKVPVKK